MIYVFGKLVTPQEQAFLRTVLTEADRTAQLRHFKALYNTAKRNNTSLQNAHNIVENNKKYVERLNKQIGCKGLYETNVYGEIIRNVQDLNGRIRKEKCLDEFIKEITDGVNVNKQEPKPTFFQDIKSSIKSGWKKFKSAFSIY